MILKECDKHWIQKSIREKLCLKFHLKQAFPSVQVKESVDLPSTPLNPLCMIILVSVQERRWNEYQGNIPTKKSKSLHLDKRKIIQMSILNNGLKRLFSVWQFKMAEQNIPICHKSRLWQAQNPHQDTDRHDNAPSGYCLLLLAHSLSLSLSPTRSHSLAFPATDGFLWVQRRARLFHSNPQPHRRKSLLEHLLISTKSQTRARERSPGIRLCSNSKGLPNSPDKPLWNSTCSGCAMGSGLPRTKTLH